jgi:RNA polymerase sigma factor (sigma-70 family)
MNVDLAAFIRRLYGRIHGTQAAGVSDVQLLDRWVSLRDEAAFEVLLWRHGPMILGVCRRVLRHREDVEDAFQATFLLLARKARAIRQGLSLVGWLYRVTYRVALRARERAACRNAKETEGVEQLVDNAPDQRLTSDLRGILDEEITGLPTKYRLPFIRCYLEGCSNEEAAAELHCPVGTIYSRLAWARQRLRSRLARRGVELPAAESTALLSPIFALPTLSPRLAETTLLGAFSYASHAAKLTGASAGAVTLAKGVMRTMFLAKLKWVGAFALALVACGAGGLAIYQAAEAGNPPNRSSTKAPTPSTQPAPAGVIQAAPAIRNIRVPSRVEGLLERVYVKEGAKVKAGQPLALVENSLAINDVEIAAAKAAAARADLAAALATKEEAKARLDRMLKLHGQNAVTPEDLGSTKLTYQRYTQEHAAKEQELVVMQAQLGQARNRLQMHEIRSPIDGIITTIHVQTGEAVKRLETVVEVQPLEKGK